MNPLLMMLFQLLQGQGQGQNPMSQNPLMTGAGGYYNSNNLNFGQGMGGSIFSPFMFNPFPFSPFGFGGAYSPFGGFNPFGGANPYGGMPPDQGQGRPELPGRPTTGIPTGRTIDTNPTPGIFPPNSPPIVAQEQPIFGPVLEPGMENKPRPVRPIRNDPNAQGIGVRRY